MRPKDFAANLAYSLSIAEWSPSGLEALLKRRLPEALNRMAPELAAYLLDSFPTIYAPTARAISSVLMDAPQFDLLLRYCRRRNVWPDLDDSTPVMRPLPAFANLDIPVLPTVAALADWLMLDLGRLDYHADPASRFEEHGDVAVNHYRYLIRRKANGGTRLIEAPKPRLKALQRMVLNGIVSRLPDHGDAFGFVPGRNCLQGAARHAGEPVVLCFDLKDFFPSIASGRVFGMFRCLGYPNAVSRCLTGLSVSKTPAWMLERLPVVDRAIYGQPHLPQGSPLSPALANKAAFALDQRLSALARRLDANYSRYADDLSFSGDPAIAGTLLRAVPEIVRDEGFEVNPAKTRIMSATSRQTVTGVVVNRHLNVERKSFDRLKAVIHACGKATDTRWQDARFRAELLGQIGWVEQVNPHRGLKLRQLLADAIARRA